MANLNLLLLIIILKSILTFIFISGNIKSVNSSNVEREFAKCDNSKLGSNFNCTTSTSQKYNSTATYKKPKSTAFQNFSSSNASEIKPPSTFLSTPPSQTILPGTARSPGLVTRTTGAIYKALSSVFSSGDSEIEIETTTLPTATPQVQSTSSAPKEVKSRANGSVKPKLKHQSTTAVVDLEYQDEPIINDHEDIVRFQTTPKTTTETKTTKRMTTKSPSKTTTSTIPTRRFPETTTQSISVPETTTHKLPPSTSKPLKTKLAATTTTTTTTTTIKPQVELAASSKLSEKSPLQTSAASSQTAQISTKTTTFNETVSTKATGLYGMLTNALRSVYNLNPFLNRTTRVAPEHELDDFKIESGKLMLGNDVIQPATSEDVHLLCKLLHKHLENVTSTTTTTTTTTPSTATSASTTTTVKPSKIEPETETPLTTTNDPFLGVSTTNTTKQKPSKSNSTSRPMNNGGKNDVNEEFYVSDPNELISSSEAHEHHLLESVFVYDSKQFKNNETLERVSRRLLLDLFDFGSKLAAEKNKKPPLAGNEYENDEEDGVADASSEDELSVGSAASAADNHHHRHQHHQRSNKFKIKIYEKFSHTTGDKVHLVYWLLEYPKKQLTNSSKNKNDTKAMDEVNSNKFRVLNERQVGQLIDQLEHAFIERNLVEANLKPVILIAPFKLSSKDGKNKHDHEMEAPHIIDDTLEGASNGVEREQSEGTTDEAKQKNAFQLLLNKFTSSNFTDNLLFFFIIFILLLMCIILCFACPLFCFKRSSSSSSPRSKNLPSNSSGGNNSSSSLAAKRRKSNTKRKRNRMDGSGEIENSAHHQGVSTIERGNLMRDPAANLICSDDQSVAAQKKAANDAIWRKLSNTTTTFVKDQSEVIMVRSDDGAVCVPILRHSDINKTISLPKNEDEGVKKSQFEWYSFEDHHQSEKKRKSKDLFSELSETNKSTINNKQPQSYTISDKKQYTKSVQTIFHEQEPTSQHTTIDESYNSESTNGYRDRIEKRSSDTLTKSELVMLKEKMIPIAQQHQQQYRQVASQTSTPSEAIYVNQSLATKAVQTGQSIDRPLELEQQQRRQQHDDDDDDVRHHQGRQSQSTSSSGDNNNKDDQDEEDKKRTPPLDRFDSSFIDSSESRSDSANKPSTIIERTFVEKQQDQDRIPKMRHLDLPPRARSKVDAIKAELSKLEQRDSPSSTANIKSSISGKSSTNKSEPDTSCPQYRRF